MLMWEATYRLNRLYKPLKSDYRAEVIGFSYGTRRDVGRKKYSFRNRPENCVVNSKKKIKSIQCEKDNSFQQFELE